MLLYFIGFGLIASIPSLAQVSLAPVLHQENPKQETVQDVTGFELEDLMNVQVISAGKKEESLSDVPAAIYVIRGEDLRRQGITTLPEALRQVPGMFVGRQDMNTWVISPRGFNSGSANKLLVLIDGRSVYSPLHSGVFWDVQDTLLEDVDRIEVIRGPGGSLWGTNAVNGVVNIITKSAEQTQGGYLGASAGIEMRGLGEARYGFQLAEEHFARIYAKYLNFDDSVSAGRSTLGGEDNMAMARAGFRTDRKLGTHEHFTFQGDAYQGGAELIVTQPSLTTPFSSSNKDRTMLQGGNLLSRWEKEFSDVSNVQVQVYFDYAFRSDNFFEEDLRTGDFDMQYRFQPFPSHDVVMGCGYRIYHSEIGNSFALSIDPEERTDDILSAFIQDEMVIIPSQLWLTIGSKFEHNDYSGFEYQPTARVSYKINEYNRIWLAGSRAVRTPSILDVDFRLNAITAPGPLLLSAFGNDDFQSEELLALELGYRTHPTEDLSFDFAFFYNDYDRLRNTQTGTPVLEAIPAPTHLLIPLSLENDNRARSYGAELASNVRLASWWLLRTNYSFIRLNQHPQSHVTDSDKEVEEGLVPTHQVWMHSAMELSPTVSLDVMARYVSRLESLANDGYVESDLRLAWHEPNGKFECALVGQNVLSERHLEYGSPTSGHEIERAAFVQLTWRF